MSKPAKPTGTAETKAFHVEVKAAPEGIIEAYAAAFDNVDDWGDVIVRGAFTKTIQERGPAGTKKIRVLLNHDSYMNLPVGTPQAMSEDGYGLLTTTKMSKTQLGQDVYTLASEGAIGDLSIGYYAMQATYPDDQASKMAGIWRVLNEVKLVEYSFLSASPANEKAIILGVKSGQDLEREIRRWTAIAQVGLATKEGRKLSGENAKRVLNALKELNDLISAAGLDEADPEDGATSTNTTAEKSSAEPPTHSLLASAIREHTRTLDTKSKTAGLLAELRSFGASLGGNQP